MAEYTHIIQPFEPVYDQESRILILGSLPSVKSRQNGFYYGNPRNRFWEVLAAIFNTEIPTDNEKKREFLLEHQIALWDVIEECDIIGSADNTIKNVVTADVQKVIRDSHIHYIYVNGKTAEKYYKKYLEQQLHIEAVVLPSTSPANAAFSKERLVIEWKRMLAVDTGDYVYPVSVSFPQYIEILQKSHMENDKTVEFSVAWRELFGNVSEIKQGVHVWYQIGIDGHQDVVMSLGDLYDRWIDQFEAREELFKAYLVDCFAMGVLKIAYSAFFEENRKFAGFHAKGMHFFDEMEMKNVPWLLKRLNIRDVSLNEALVMTPQKTVVFSTFYCEESVLEKRECDFFVCEVCTNQTCPNREKAQLVSLCEDKKTADADLEGDSKRMAQKVKERKLKVEKVTGDIKNKSGNYSYGFQRIMRNDK